MLLVFCLGMVLVAMRSAGNPQNWRWLTDAGKPRVAPPLELVEIDPATGQPRAAPAPTKLAPTENAPASEESSEPTLHPTQPLSALAADFWQRFVRQLDRASQTNLDRLAFPPPPGAEAVSVDSAANLVERLRAYYQKYTAELLAQAGQLGTADASTRQAAYDLMFDWQQDWRDSVEPQLAAWASGNAATNLEPLQAALDSAAAAFVADQTPIPAATDHLFVRRLVAHCEQLSGAESATAPSTQFLQLLNQPATYRGKLVAIEGRIRGARRIASNRSGPAATFYEWWVQPSDGTTVPFCVLTAHWPQGLPEPSETLEALNQPARFVGFFYKVRSYLAAGGRVQFSPTILAAAPQFTGADSAAAAPPAWWWLPLLALLGAILAGGAALSVYRMSQPIAPTRRRPPSAPIQPRGSSEPTVSATGESTASWGQERPASRESAPASKRPQ